MPTIVDHSPAAPGLLFGAAAAWPALRDDPEYASHFAAECGILVPENVLKMGPVHPEPERYNFAPGDFMADFLEDHIRTVAGRYKGRMHSWDVVNEAVLPTNGREDGLRKTAWLEMLGPDYLEMAFRAAQEADPKAMLCYNDYGVDYDTPEQEAKRAAILKLLRRFFSEIAGLGLKILITELDVVDRGLPDDIDERDKGIAAVYESYLTAALRAPAVIAVLTWGLTDQYTWLASRNRRESGTPVRVLPLDREYRRKPACHAIARAFDSRRA